MLEQLVQNSVEKVPALAMMVVVVVAFLRHLKHRDTHAQELHRESNEIIIKNTEVLGGVGEIINRCNGTLQAKQKGEK
jgi:hypothetical protein